MMEQTLWCEKYRPKTIADCVLSASNKKIFEGIVKSKAIQNLLLFGSAGTGKTTVARALCNELEYDFIFINASEERGIDMLRDKILNYSSSVSIYGKRKCVILDEADSLTIDAQSALRATMEQHSSNCTFILTCNFKDKIIAPLHSRCSAYNFTISKADKVSVIGEVFKRVLKILDEEKVKYKKAVIVEVVRKFFPDFRRIINELQSYSKFDNNIDDGIFSVISDINISKLFTALKNKKYHDAREWVVEHVDIDHSKIYRKIYDNISDHLSADSVPGAVVILADYQHKSAFAADQEINLLACIVSMMFECEFK